MKAMTKYKEKVKDLCDKVYTKTGYPQIIIDLVQETIEPLFYPEQPLKRDDVAAVNYDIGLIEEILNPVFEITVIWLKEMSLQITAWEQDIEWNNGVLGLPKES